MFFAPNIYTHRTPRYDLIALGLLALAGLAGCSQSSPDQAGVEIKAENRSKALEDRGYSAEERAGVEGRKG